MRVNANYDIMVQKEGVSMATIEQVKAHMRMHLKKMMRNLSQ